MAVTKGHGNPNWSRDETILALDLYFKLNGASPSPTEPAVVELSRFLRSMPYHAVAARKQSFRNPDGVAFKIGNLKSFATGRGLSNVSATDRSVWEAYGTDAFATAVLAAAIRAGVSELPPDEVSDEEEFAEGQALTRLHRTRERNPKIRGKLIAERRKEGHLRCDLCDRTTITSTAGYDDAEFEAHHVLPISQQTVLKTRLKDMALLCAGCHRLLHRLMARQKRIVALAEARELLGLRGSDRSGTSAAPEGV